MNLHKIKFFLLAIPVALLGMFILKWMVGGDLPSRSSFVRMAFAYRNGIAQSKLDPAKVDTIAKAHMIRMMYSRLVEYSSDGQLQGSLAESFRIEGNKAIFRIRDDFRSSKGNPITAEDVALSFRRLLVRNSNTHGRLGLFICAPALNIDSVFRDCPGIAVRGNEVEFEMHPGVSPGFFIPMLASTDFSIIPRLALDLTKDDVPIINYEDTSGFYYLAKDDPENFKHEFRINEHHPMKLSSMAERVIVDPLFGDDAVAGMIAGEIDFIPTSTFLTSANTGELKTHLEDHVQIHATLPIQLHAVMFTPRGFNELTVKERVALGSKIKRRYLEVFSKDALEGTNQIFPSLGEGELLPDEEARIQKMYETAANAPLPRRNYQVGVAPGDDPLFIQVLAEDVTSHAVEIKVLSRAPWTLPTEEQPHAYVATQDSAFYEDISLVSYGFQHGFLHVENSDAWIKMYISTDTKELRMGLLRRLHYQSLIQGRVIPLGVASYRAAARKPWNMSFPQYFAGSPLWMLHQR